MIGTPIEAIGNIFLTRVEEPAKTYWMLACMVEEGKGNGGLRWQFLDIELSLEEVDAIVKDLKEESWTLQCNDKDRSYKITFNERQVSKLLEFIEAEFYMGL